MSKIKPGSLCEVVGGVDTPGLKGRFVIAIRLANDDEFFPTDQSTPWMCKSAVEGDLLPVTLIGLVTGRITVGPPSKERPIGERFLRPIDDPGEDAQDQTLQWLDVPSAEKVDA